MNRLSGFVRIAGATWASRVTLSFNRALEFIDRLYFPEEHEITFRKRPSQRGRSRNRSVWL